MKILNTILVIVCSIFFSGTLYSGTSDSGRSSALMKALISQHAEMLSGEIGVSIIFVQSLDGVSRVRNVEALNTLYLLAHQEGDQTLVFETEKTNKELYLSRYRLVNDIWLGAIPYNPADLPDIDFQKAYRLVKAYAGKHKTIASISVSYADTQHPPLIVSFQIKDDAAEFCEQWVYYVDTNEVVQTKHRAGCFFDLNEDSFDMDEDSSLAPAS